MGAADRPQEHDRLFQHRLAGGSGVLQAADDGHEFVAGNGGWRILSSYLEAEPAEGSYLAAAPPEKSAAVSACLPGR
ncbi:MAG: hypothetical protein JWL97_3849 [Gemmatimonadales bacterium]|nr:hypothetical protein [Gemmatimonadales bacterium]